MMDVHGYVLDSEYACDNNGDNYRLKRSTLK